MNTGPTKSLFTNSAMKNYVITVFCITCNMLVSGSSRSDQVHQTPTDIINIPGQTATITCSHSIDSYDQILWYKQSNSQLQFLGYYYVERAYPETGEDVKMDGGANKNQNCTLTIPKLEHSAVYFCAASLHNATHRCSSVQKPPHSMFSSLTARSHLCFSLRTSLFTLVYRASGVCWLVYFGFDTRPHWITSHTAVTLPHAAPHSFCFSVIKHIVFSLLWTTNVVDLNQQMTLSPTPVSETWTSNTVSFVGQCFSFGLKV
ncbi:uncharacterized protein LOC113148717 [Anabas testudineus]|uniref:uncharacterized protein LOC113148717 n=1 Tax=Anabas testudineus TaxID=64144 RepID=UPI000E4601DF|nr:uncharacterized protein LOC113148717 [Anabas testudineus]XP_026196294.1 uncharacterized protein LOC113148717 [Anabas testudineus]